MGYYTSGTYFCNSPANRYLGKIFMPNLARKFEGCFSSLSGIGFHGAVFRFGVRRVALADGTIICLDKIIKSVKLLIYYV
jgi:hypothetical protein